MNEKEKVLKLAAIAEIFGLDGRVMQLMAQAQSNPYYYSRNLKQIGNIFEIMAQKMLLLTNDKESTALIIAYADRFSIEAENNPAKLSAITRSYKLSEFLMPEEGHAVGKVREGIAAYLITQTKSLNDILHLLHSLAIAYKFEIETSEGIVGKLCSRLREDSGGLLDKLKAQVGEDEAKGKAYALVFVYKPPHGGVRCYIEADYVNSTLYIYTFTHAMSLKYLGGWIISVQRFVKRSPSVRAWGNWERSIKSYTEYLNECKKYGEDPIERIGDNHTIEAPYKPEILKGYLLTLVWLMMAQPS